jgi:hypothetical protein
MGTAGQLVRVGLLASPCSLRRLKDAFWITRHHACGDPIRNSSRRRRLS